MRNSASLRFLSSAVVFAAITVTAWPAVCFGQTETASIYGRVSDQSGAVVPSAEVRLHNIDTNVDLTRTTNQEGFYLLPALKPGRYLMVVTKQGFRTVTLKDIILNVQDNVVRNFQLQVGSISESMTVTADALNVNTTDASVSTVIDRKFVESLPLNGRSFNTLLQLTPGVVIAPSSQMGVGNQTPGQFSIAGQRTDANSFSVDGVSANFGVAPTFLSVGAGTGTAQAFSALGGTSSLVSVDALQEFRIQTSSFAPEFGRSPGGQVILTTRAGTNSFHGGLFDYFRNTVMDANDWFNNAAIPRIPRAPEHHNDFGGFVGGPIWKDKTFFFVSYEGARLDTPHTGFTEVPSMFARTQAPPTLTPFLDAFPQPNGPPPTPTSYSAPLTASFSNRATLDAGSIRIDHQLSDRFSIFARYNDAPSTVTDRTITLPNNPLTISINTQTLTVGVNMLSKAGTTNTLRANYSTQSSGSEYSMDSFGGAVPITPSLLLGNLQSANSFAEFVSFDIAAQYSIGPSATNRTKQLNFVDDFTRSFGTHQLKLGADYRAIFLEMNPFQNALDLFVFSIQGFVSNGQADLVVGQNAAKHPRLLTQAFSLYGQDTWKLTSRLTLTYGLRWELSPAPTGRDGTTLAAWKNVTNPTQLTLAPAGTPVWSTTYTNLAPRLGMAYSLTEKGDLVLRLGGGIFYDLGTGETAQLGTSFPNFSQAFSFSVNLPIADATPYLPGLSSQPPFPNGVVGYSPSLKLPRSYQWNVALEKSFLGRQALSATYVGQAGKNLLRQEAFSQPNPNFLGDFFLWQEDAFSNYNALQLQYRRSFSSHLQALLNYTWSHSLDNSSNDAVTALSSTVISAAKDYASSDFDVRHMFSGGINYAIPGISRNKVASVLTKNWSVDTVIVARTGFPFNLFVRSTSPDPSGIAVSRPDRDFTKPVYLTGSQCTSVFQGLGALSQGQTCPGGKGVNPAAFSIPATVRQGTEGRNDIPGFALMQVDLSIARTFPVTDRVKVHFRTDAFNILNHPNFANPPALLDGGAPYLLSSQILNRTLGGLNSVFQQGGPRSLQVSLRLQF